MRSKWAMVIGMVVVLCAGLAWGELGNWLQDVPAAKTEALGNSRPLLVMDGNSVSCSYCIAAENGVFSKAAWKGYARAKGITQYYADGHFAASAKVDKALNTEYGIPLFPTILIFRVLDTADLTTTDLNDATNKVPVRNVELVGRFLYRQGKTINGIYVNSPNPANFIAILESFYRTTHPAWLQDVGGSPTDTTPEPFTFTDQTGVARSTLCASNPITVAGINAAAAISISGNAGQYRINSGPWTAVSGTVVNGDLVTVQQTSSPNYATTTSTTLTIGGVQDAFSVTTVAAPGADTTPEPFTFTDQTGVARSTLCTSNPITVAGINAAAAISISGNAGQYRINSGPWTAVPGTVANGSLVTVQQTSSPNYATTTSTTLNIGGVADTFGVTTQAQSALSCVGTLFDAGKSDLPAVRGTITLAASTAGRILVKLTLLTRSYSYAIPSWTAVDDDGTRHAESTDARTGASLELAVDPAGHAVGRFSASEGDFSLEMDPVTWNGSTNPASEYVGYYTVSLPVDVTSKASGAAAEPAAGYLPYGGGYLVFTVTAAGKATYSGKLADGMRFSGSTVLVEAADDEGDVRGVLTVFVPLYSKRGSLAGQLAVVPLADRVEGEASVSLCGLTSSWEWSYPGQSPRLGRSQDAFTVGLTPSGAAYVKGATLESLGIMAAELLTGEPPFDAAYAYTANGAKAYVYPVEEAFPLQLDLTVAGNRLVPPAATSPVRQSDGSYLYEGSNDSGLRATYSPSTGVFSGSFKLYYDYLTTSWQHRTVTVTFEGVLTPAQGGACTPEPLHLGHGFFLVSDSNEAAGYSFKRSYPVWLDRPLP